MTRPLPPSQLARRAVLAGLAVGLTGCGAIAGLSRPPRLYVLSPKSTFPAGGVPVSWQLAVETPTAAGGLNTTRIAVTQQPYRLDYYASASWTDAAPLMVQTLLIESFENSGRIGAVGRNSVTFRADYLLVTELREFQAFHTDQNLPPTVDVRINAKLVVLPTREIVGSESFEALEPATDDSMDAVVRAFDQALGKVLRRIVEWTVSVPIPRR